MAKKPLSFKDMMTVDNRPGEDELTKYRAHKRRRGQGAGSNAEYSSTHPPRKEQKESLDWVCGSCNSDPCVCDGDITEALNIQQRMARGRLMKRMKAKIKIGRDRAKRRMANKDTLERRAQKQARKMVLKKLTKGVDKSELNFARRQELEKRLDKPAVKKRIQMLAKRILKDVRKKEVERKKG